MLNPSYVLAQPENPTWFLDRDAPVNIVVIINRKKENYTNFYLC